MRTPITAATISTTGEARADDDPRAAPPLPSRDRATSRATSTTGRMSDQTLPLPRRPCGRVRRLRIHQDGTAVLWCHGGPGSRLEPAAFAPDAAKAGFEYIGIDRPGYGCRRRSRSGRSLTGCPTAWPSPTRSTSIGSSPSGVQRVAPTHLLSPRSPRHECSASLRVRADRHALGGRTSNRAGRRASGSGRRRTARREAMEVAEWAR